ncbi:MAG: hypothetical protein IB618_00500 [Candidatus Pacearchaeota archaeon]|nr:MAG: hypothetical protein IB618_00500 [Candidatus Pacearchaeota archaeon]
MLKPSPKEKSSMLGVEMSREELEEHLSSILSRYLAGVKVVGVDVVPIERSIFNRRQGNKTLTNKITIKDYTAYPSPGSNLHLPMNFIIKKDKDEAHYALRRTILDICNKDPLRPDRYSSFLGAWAGTFPYCWSVGYEPFDKLKLTLSTFVSEKSLDERMKELVSGINNGNSKLIDVEILKQANNPKIVIHEKLSLYEGAIVRDLRSKIREPSLEDLTKIYMNSLVFLSGKDAKGWPKSLKKETEKAFKNLAKKYLAEDNLKTLDQFDGYPWHNLFVCLVDPGSVKRISRGIGLAAQWCFPTIFNYFKNPKTTIKILTEDYVKKRKNFLEELQIKDAPEINQEELERAIYFGGLFINTRHTSVVGNGSDEDIKPYINSIKTLFKICENIESGNTKKLRKPYEEFGLFEKKSLVGKVASTAKLTAKQVTRVMNS